MIGYFFKTQQTYGVKEETEEIEREFPTDGKQLIKAHKQLILRAYVQYKSPYILTASHHGKEIPSEGDYTYNHVAILENQLRLPPVGAATTQTTDEWYDFKINNKSHMI